MGDELISWKAPEYVRNERTADWYWAVSLLGIAGVFASVYFGNYLFGVVVLLSFVLIVIASLKPVRIHDVVIMENGIKVDSLFTSFEHISGYWIYNHPREGEKLLLKSSTVLIPVAVLPLVGQVTAEQLRGLLGTKAQEVEIKIPILVQIFEELF
jgi:hypothetical protein